MKPRLRRLAVSVLLTSGVAVLSAPASFAATEYLGYSSTPGTASFSTSGGVYAAFKFTVPAGAGASVGYATAMVERNPATRVSQLSIFGSNGSGAINPTPLATLAQSTYQAGGFTPPYSTVYEVGFTGSVTLAPGEYYASVSTATGNQNVWGGQGAQSSPWTWGPRNTGANTNFPYYFTIDSGSSWILSNNASTPLIALFDQAPPAPPSSGSSPSSSGSTDSTSPVGPGPVLQQVRVPMSGTCADVPDAELAIGTGLAGGWGMSWAEWANGPVCTRTLEFTDGVWHLG